MPEAEGDGAILVLVADADSAGNDSAGDDFGFDATDAVFAVAFICSSWRRTSRLRRD